MNHFFQILSFSSLLCVAGCSTTSEHVELSTTTGAESSAELTASSLELPEGVRSMPEGASWLDVFDASEGSTELARRV